MPSELVRPENQAQALSRKVEVEVLSRANPEVALLRLARVVVQQSPEVRAVFDASREDKSMGRKGQVNRKLLTERLKDHFPLDEGIGEVASYLADEYEQIGDGILLVSSETGRAIARLTEEDFYMPAPVPRESGNMVQPGVKIRPEIEGFIVHWQFETTREREVRERMLSRVNQSELLREEGDRRVLSLSRGGRRNLAAQVQEALPQLLQGATGIAGDFLVFFAPGKPPSGEGLDPIKLEARSSVRRPVQDALTSNLKHDVLASTLASVATGWVRDMAGQLLTRGRSRLGDAVVPYMTLDMVVENRKRGFWVAESSLALALQRLGCRALPVQGPSSFALFFRGPVGFLELPEGQSGVHSREMHDRWTLESMVEATLWVDWGRIEVLPVGGVFDSGVSVEVL